MSSHDDLPPAPFPGEDTSAYHQRLLAMRTPSLTPKTRFSVDLKILIAAVFALASGVWWAATTYYTMTQRADRLDERITYLQSSVATKADLRQVRDEVINDIRVKLREAVVRCPKFVLRGETVVNCKVLIVGD